MADTEFKKGDTATGLKGFAFGEDGSLTDILKAADKLEVRIKSAGKFITGTAEVIEGDDQWNWRWLPEEAAQVETLDPGYQVELWVYVDEAATPPRIMKLPNELTQNPTLAITQDLVP